MSEGNSNETRNNRGNDSNERSIATENSTDEIAGPTTNEENATITRTDRVSHSCDCTCNFLEVARV